MVLQPLPGPHVLEDFLLRPSFPPQPHLVHLAVEALTLVEARPEAVHLFPDGDDAVLLERRRLARPCAAQQQTVDVNLDEPVVRGRPRRGDVTPCAVPGDDARTSVIERVVARLSARVWEHVEVLKVVTEDELIRVGQDQVVGLDLGAWRGGEGG